MIFGCLSRTLRSYRWPARAVSPLRCPAYSAPLLSLQVRYQVTLRPYQEESIQAVLAHLEDGHRRLGISLATGAGKTVIFSQLVGRIKAPNGRATRTLILVHRRELVEQAHRHCVQAYPELKVEVDMGKLHASGTADITIASVLSLTRGRLENYDPSTYKLVMVDEAHHMVSESYLKVLNHFGLVSSTAGGDGTEGREVFQTSRSLQRAPALVGVSATFSRFDGLSLGHAIDHIVYHKDYIDLIDENWLSDVLFTTVDSKVDLSKVRSHTDGDFLSSSLSVAMNTDITNDIVVRTWLLKAKERRSTLVFCVDVAHVNGLQAKFLGHGIEARCVTAKTPLATRSAIVQSFKEGQFPVLLNCGIFTEGTDIPNIDCVILARPTKSRNLLVQMIGRGMRLHSDKQDCHIIDMVSALRTGIVTVPTLFGLDPNVLVERASTSDMEAQRQRSNDSLQRVGEPTSLGSSPGSWDKNIDGNLTFKEYSSVADLLNDTTDKGHIRRISSNSWVYVGRCAEGHDRHVLSGTGNAYLTIKDLGEREPRYEVLLTAKVPKDSPRQMKRDWIPYRRPEKLAFSKTFGDAIHAADTYAASDGRFPRYLIERNQGWRGRPATAGQVEFLRKLKIGDEDWDPAQFTTGQCAEMITKIKFGAKGLFKSIVTDRARLARSKDKKEREKRLKERETIRVGPLSQSTFSDT